MNNQAALNDPLAQKYLSRGGKLESDMETPQQDNPPSTDDPLANKYLSLGGKLESQMNGDGSGQTPSTQPQEKTGDVAGQEAQSPLGMYDGSLGSVYKVFSALPEETKQEMFNDALRVAIKAPVAGAGKLLDFFSTMPINAAVDAINGLAHTDIPHSKSFESKAEEGIDYLTGGHTKGSGHVYEGVKLATELALPAGIASRLTLGAYEMIKDSPVLIEVLKKIGTNNPKALAGAVGAGAAMHEAEKREAGVGGTLAAGAGGALATEAALSISNPKQALLKGATMLAGVGKKSLKQDVVDSAKAIDVEVPLAAVTDSTGTALANQFISKTPILGGRLRDAVKNTSDQFQKAFNKTLDSVGEKKEQAEQAIKVAYNKLKNLTKKDDFVDSSSVLEKITNIREELQTFFHAKPTKNLFSIFDEIEQGLRKGNGVEKLPDGFHNMNKSVQEQLLKEAKSKGSQVSVHEMVNAKKQINRAMRDKDLFDRNDKDALEYLKGVGATIDSILHQYGTTRNPEFLASLRTANKLFEKTAKREALEDLFSGVISGGADSSVQYKGLYKILEDRDSQKMLLNNFGETNYNKLQDFVNVAKGMAAAEKNVLNPSGTAIVGSVIGFIQGLVFGTNLVPTILGGLGAFGIQKLLTSQKFIDIASEFAKKPSPTLANRLNNVVKDNLGLSIQTVMENIGKMEAEKANELH